MTPTQFIAAQAKIAHIRWRVRFALSRGVGIYDLPAARLTKLIGDVDTLAAMLRRYRDAVVILENTRADFRINRHEL